MKKIILCIFIFFLMSSSFALMKRFEKIYDKKYESNDEYRVQETFKHFAEMTDASTSTSGYVYKVVTDDWLYKNFESKHIKYILIEKEGIPFGCGYVSVIFIPKSTKLPDDKPSEYYIFQIENDEFNELASLINMVTKYEVMCDINTLSKRWLRSFDNRNIITYFNGKEQKTSYFSSPEYSIRDDDVFKKDLTPKQKEGLKAARYLMYAWEDLQHDYMVSDPVDWIESNEKIMKKLKMDREKALEELKLESKKNKTDKHLEEKPKDNSIKPATKETK